MISFDYTVKPSSRARNLRITISEKGEVVVIKPRFVPQFLIDRFIKDNENWVLKHLHLLKTKKRNIANKLYYKGYEYLMMWIKGKLAFNSNNNVLTISALTPETGIRALEKRLKEEAKTEIIKTVKQQALRMNLTYNAITIRDQTSRWGSCSTKKNLNFSWRLIMAPPECLRYVVIHELGHLKHMDHSDRFWQLVEKYEPDYRDHRRWLRRHQHDLHIEWRNDQNYSVGATP